MCLDLVRIEMYSSEALVYDAVLCAVADPDQGYQGLSTGQIFNPEQLAEWKRELPKAVISISSLLATTIEAV